MAELDKNRSAECSRSALAQSVRKLFEFGRFGHIDDGKRPYEAGPKTFSPAAFVVHGGIANQDDVDQLGGDRKL